MPARNATMQDALGEAMHRLNSPSLAGLGRGGRHIRPQVNAVVALAVLLALAWGAWGAQEVGADRDARTTTADLIERYAPILVLRAQERPCDPAGEPYVAAPVEIVLGDPIVRLRHDGTGKPVIVDGPTAPDIDGLDDTYYLDLPGNPLRPGCVYERRSRERMQGLVPMAMVHLARERIGGGLAIQYWLFYYFNDWNNTHEGDWEMIQVVFDVDTVEEALRTDPVEVGFAQHAGGERAAWDESKLDREGDRPVVYVARGSHASHFDQAVYLGWGEDGTGVGCDITQGPSIVVPIQTRLVADDTVTPTWAEDCLRFDGRWGQRAPWEFNGPRGPNNSGKWARPSSWQENLRDASLAVPLSGALGPTPTDIFCQVTARSADMLRLGSKHPRLVVLGGTLVLVCLAAFLIATWRTLTGALRLYVRHFPTFLPAVLAVVALGVGASVLIRVSDALVARGPTADVPAARSAITIGLAIVQQIAGLVVVAPLAVYATAELSAGRRLDMRMVLGAERAYLGRTTRALARPLLAATLAGLLPFGVIPATVLAVRWFFIPQAVLLDGASPAKARGASMRAVWRQPVQTVALMFLLVVLVVPGPLVGVLVLVYATQSFAIVNLASGIVYAIVTPFAFVAATLLYLHGRQDATATG